MGISSVGQNAPGKMMDIFNDARTKGYTWALSQEPHSEYTLLASHAAFWKACLKGTEFEDEMPGEANVSMMWDAWERGVFDAKVFLRDDSLIGAGEIAERTGFNISYIKAELKKGNLKGQKIGNSYAVHPDDFRRWHSNPQRGERGGRSKKQDA